MASTFSPREYLEPLASAFTMNANVEKAEQMHRYVRNKFSFFGIHQPLRKAIWKSFKQDHALPGQHHINDIIEWLWKYDEREFQMVALDLLFESRKNWKEDQIVLLENLVVQKSWWDTVDMLSSKLAGYYFKKYPQRIPEITMKWNQSHNMWLNRSSILFQLKYKQDTDFDLLKRYIFTHLSSKEFFLQKAIGWSLREYAKTNPAGVLEFVRAHPLAPLSKREALRLIK